MEVRFFTFNKKYNSTKRPALNTGTSYNCVLKSSSNVITPTIELQIGLTVNPSSFNYCYITDYQRYYWVREWTFSGHLWIAELNVDVLATWRPYIGSTDMYVYRSSNEYDGKLLDTKYTTTADITYYKQDIRPIGTKFSDGYFVVGIYGGTENTTTVSYYSFSAPSFGTLIEKIYSVGVLDGEVWGTIAVGVRNAVFDIASYIKSCRWFPVDCGSGITLNTLKVGALTLTGLSYKKVSDMSNGVASTITFQLSNIPKHPQAVSRGIYCNLSPYSRYKLIYLPFGTFELDTVLLADKTFINGIVYIDAVSGLGTLRVTARTGDLDVPPVTLLTRTAQYGVDIPISVTEVNVPSVASSLAGAGISATHGNIFSAGVSAISSVAEIIMPSLDSVSNSHGGISLIDYTNNMLECVFVKLADEDNNSNGRPLCKVRKPQNLSGYIEGESGTFSAPATITEMEEIKNFIDSGFYYE